MGCFQLRAIIKQAAPSLGGSYHLLFRVQRTRLPLQREGFRERGPHAWSSRLSTEGLGRGAGGAEARLGALLEPCSRGCSRGLSQLAQRPVGLRVRLGTKGHFCRVTVTVLSPEGLKWGGEPGPPRRLSRCSGVDEGTSRGLSASRRGRTRCGWRHGVRGKAGRVPATGTADQRLLRAEFLFPPLSRARPRLPGSLLAPQDATCDVLCLGPALGNSRWP